MNSHTLLLLNGCMRCRDVVDDEHAFAERKAVSFHDDVRRPRLHVTLCHLEVIEFRAGAERDAVALHQLLRERLR